MTTDARVEFHGWVFHDHEGIVDRALEEVTDAVSIEAHDRIQQRFNRVLRNPTGYLASRVRVDRRSAHQFVVDDGGVIYGPWIEGTGSRNRTTRFKGYRTYRLISQELEADGPGIAQQVLSRELPR